MDTNQPPNSKNYNFGDKLKNVSQFPLTLVIIVASYVVALILIPLLIKFLKYACEVYDLKFWE